MSLDKKQILILGGTGFIGHNLVERFSKNPEYKVYATHFKREAPAYDGVTWVRCDLRDPAQCDRLLAGKDIVVQAAATTSGAKDIVQRPYLHVTDNAVMNSYLLQSAFDQQVKHFLFFSCTVMYPSSEVAQKESDFTADSIHDRYFGVGWTKVYVEKMCEFYSRLGKTKFSVLRHSNIYGPYDKFDLEKSHVFGATMTKVMTAMNGEITVWGTGEEARDLLYVDDLMECVEMMLKKQQTPFELVNVGLGQATMIKDLVQKIISHSGREIKINFDLSKPTIKTVFFPDLTKIKNFGWQPKHSLDQGIKKTIEWYKKHQST